MKPDRLLPNRLLIVEGNPEDRRRRAEALGVASASALYARAISAHFPEIAIDIAFAADPMPWLHQGRSFGDYFGMVVGGSSLHAYDDAFEVTNQIALLRAACEAGLPVLGSCWGLQIAAVAAGGRVERSPSGREVGIARKIARTPAGRAHPLLGGRPDCFDAPCIHYDEVTALPEGCTLLAGNAHSAIQAAIVPLGRSEVWGVQYHPEFDLGHVADLYRLYADDMVAQGFFADAEECRRFAERTRALGEAPDAHPDLAWQMGVDADLLDDRRRRSEIVAWVEVHRPG